MGLPLRVEGEGVEGETTGLLPDEPVEELVAALLHCDAVDETLAA